MAKPLKEIEVDRKRVNLDIILKEVLFALILIIFVGIVLLLTFNVFGSDFDREFIPTCGDGSFYEACSLNKPFFCNSEGVLVEKASICGCPEILNKEEDFCISAHSTDQKDVELKYILRGQEESILFTMYGGAYDYVSSLPRFIFYEGEEIPLRSDFKLNKINDELQRQLILPLVVRIQNLAFDSQIDQARIAISLVQNIPYDEFNETFLIENDEEIILSRFPYQTLFETSGSCEGKSELLALLLREIGYDVALFYYKLENHESLGIKCPLGYSVGGSGYCFVETTSPSILTDDKGEYLGTGKLFSEPEVVLISKGISLPKNLFEYKDAKDYLRIREKGFLNVFNRGRWNELNEKYGIDFY